MNLLVLRLLVLGGALVVHVPNLVDASNPNILHQSDVFATDVAKFYLYTKENPSLPQELYIDDEASVQNSNFNAERLTKIIIHGWTKSYLEIPNNQLIDAYTKVGDYNLISIDWSEIAATLYLNAKARSPAVGAKCAQFVRFLANKFGLDVSRLVVIGHSMGAHIAGFCGKELKYVTDNPLELGAIVALDVAYPLYIYSDTSDRVAQSDAKFVLSLHTNGLLKGTLRPIGHASYYANNGRKQPGCGLDIDGTCAHARCVHIFAEAIQGYQFTPYKACESYEELMINNSCNYLPHEEPVLGDPLDVAQVHGIFSFETNGETPFGSIG